MTARSKRATKCDCGKRIDVRMKKRREKASGNEISGRNEIKNSKRQNKVITRY